MDTVSAYYDAFCERLVEDYEIQNRRVVAALEFTEDALGDAESVLDVGCGIGWSSSYLAERGLTVLGIDVSPVLVETAREMFGDVCEFEVADFAEFESGPFDAVVGIDVYEHFPPRSRPSVHASIRRTGARRVVLTMPTPKTQQYARDLGIPLQPIDEDVTDEDIQSLADDIGGTVSVNRTVSIWRDDDYRHVLIEVEP